MSGTPNDLGRPSAKPTQTPNPGFSRPTQGIISDKNQNGSQPSKGSTEPARPAQQSNEFGTRPGTNPTKGETQGRPTTPSNNNFGTRHGNEAPSKGNGHAQPANPSNNGFGTRPAQEPNAPSKNPTQRFPFEGGHVGYGDLVEARVGRGELFRGPCLVGMRLNHPLVAGEAPSGYQRVAVAADSGNGVSAVLDYRRYLFVNADLTIHLLRRPAGEWIGLDARTSLGPQGTGLAESALYDEHGLIGRSLQSLAVRAR